MSLLSLDPRPTTRTTFSVHRPRLDIRMKAAFVLIFCLPCLFAETASDVALDAYKRMTPEERMSVHEAFGLIKHWFASHGTQLTASACTVFCATATAVETLGISAPICAAACALIGLIG
uniref:Uncharacterized protein n=1 Tax=Magallana gigas TaxID=29159 RepID=A0A8W8LJF3_MAGGI